MTRSVSEAADAGVGQIDVRGEQRSIRDFDDDVRQRLVDGQHARAEAAHAGGAEVGGKRLAQRLRRLDRVGGRLAGGQRDDQVEAGVLGQQHEQPVEDREARVDVRAAGPGDGHLHAETLCAAARCHSATQVSTRSMRAPSARSRSSIRS